MNDVLLQAALTAPQDSLLPLDDSIVTRRPGWYQLMTPSIRFGGMNEVVITAIDGDVAQAIDETIATYQQHGLAFRFELPPSKQQEEISEVLRARGFVESRTLVMTTPADPNARPELIVKDADVATFTRVMAEGWGVGTDGLFALHSRMKTAGRPLLVAYVDGVPAGSASMGFNAHCSYLIGGVVLPAFRKRGVYAALVADRVRRTAEVGLAFAATHARAETSAPLLLKRGFSAVAELRMFSSQAI